MKNALVGMLVAAFTFIQFRNPATDELMFVMEPFTDAAGNEQTRRAKDADGNDMPIGVKAYGLGSKPYRRSFENIQTENIKRGKKGMNGAIMRANATKLLSETVFEFVNFDYNGQGCTKESVAAMLEDDAYAAIREQIENEQGDLGNFSKST